WASAAARDLRRGRPSRGARRNRRRCRRGRARTRSPCGRARRAIRPCLPVAARRSSSRASPNGRTGPTSCPGADGEECEHATIGIGVNAIGEDVECLGIAHLRIRVDCDPAIREIAGERIATIGQDRECALLGLIHRRSRSGESRPKDCSRSPAGAPRAEVSPFWMLTRSLTLVEDVVYKLANCAMSNATVPVGIRPTVRKLCVTTARPGRVYPKKMSVISMTCRREFVDSRVPIFAGVALAGPNSPGGTAAAPGRIVAKASGVTMTNINLTVDTCNGVSGTLTVTATGTTDDGGGNDTIWFTIFDDGI